MTETRLDWEPVARSLVLHLVDHDVIPVAVYDGAYTTRITRASASKMADQVAEIACGVDEAALRCIWYTSTSQLRCSLVLVFGNEPDEVVADYTWENGDDALESAIELALEDFGTEWEGKACPRVQVAS